MKIMPQHYEFIREQFANKITLIDIPELRETLSQNPKVKDVDKRIRWDLLSIFVGSKWVCDNLYQYANDDHIDTALRKIMSEHIPS